MFWNKLRSQDSRKDFKAKIQQYYLDLAGNNLPEETIVELSDHITKLVYAHYTDCRKKYPKSRKRYATLKVKDLDSPYYQFRIYDFFKTNEDAQYATYTRKLLGLSESEYLDFEKRRLQFENM